MYAPSCLVHEHLTRAASVVGIPGETGTRQTLLGNYRNLDAVGGESFASYVDRFAAAALDGRAPPAPLVDACDGFACGEGCFSMHRGEIASVVKPKTYVYGTTRVTTP